MKLYFKAMIFLCYNILATYRIPKQRQRKHFHFQCSPRGIFLKFKKRNVLTGKAWMSELERNKLGYSWRYGLFLKFSQSDQWFNNIAISTFLHSTAVALPSSCSDRYSNVMYNLVAFHINRGNILFFVKLFVIVIDF